MAQGAKDLRDLPFPMLADGKKDRTSALGIQTPTKLRGVAAKGQGAVA